MNITTLHDPFFRGSLPVSQRTVSWHDAVRRRTFHVELYQPRLPDGIATLPQPLVLFAHGWYGNRGECSVLCSHLASHGYRVVAADFGGSTAADVEAQLDSAEYDFETSWESIARHRMNDLPFLIDAASHEFGETITVAGVTGSSLGGWSALMATIDPRVRAIVPLCPVGGPGPLAFKGVPCLSRYLEDGWQSVAEITTLVADQDSWLPLYGQIDLFARLQAPSKRLIVLRGADHLHFIDAVTESHASFAAFTRRLADIPGARGVPWQAMAGLIRPAADLMPEAEAQTIVCGLTTLQMDAALKSSSAARDTLETAGAELRRRGLDAYALTVG